MRGFAALLAFAATLSLLLFMSQPDPPMSTLEVVSGGFAQVSGSACEIANFAQLKKAAIVYTWVNGSESCYNARRARAGLSPGGSSRDKEMGELKYSIRSLLKYAPWLEGPIYIVTPGQIPDWLDDDLNGRITVIDQDSLFPLDLVTRPNFDTNVIEQFLYRIPGLTDIFIHMNDDYVFVKPVAPQRLFTCDGGLQFLTEINHIRHVKGERSNAWLASVRNTVELMDQTYGGEHVYNFLKHAPFVYSRRAFAHIHAKFANELHAMHTHRLRHFQDLNVPLLHHIYMYEEGSRALGIPVAFNPIAECDDWLLVRVTDDNHADLTARFDAALAQRGPEILLALNDEYTSAETATLVAKFYAALLPDAAPHELPSGKARAVVSNYRGDACVYDPGVLPLLPMGEAPVAASSLRRTSHTKDNAVDDDDTAALFQYNHPSARTFRRFFPPLSSAADASVLALVGFATGVALSVFCTIYVVRIASSSDSGLFGRIDRSKSR